VVAPDAAVVAERFGVGTPRRPMERVHGGLLNRMWRLDTDEGSFAVKELNLHRDWTYRPHDVLRLEVAAFEAGVPMPEPMPRAALIGRRRSGRQVRRMRRHQRRSRSLSGAPVQKPAIQRLAGSTASARPASPAQAWPAARSAGPASGVISGAR
jgi:hypothetical protein